MPWKAWRGRPMLPNDENIASFGSLRRQSVHKFNKRRYGIECFRDGTDSQTEQL
jgi:hypothetical protein